MLYLPVGPNTEQSLMRRVYNILQEGVTSDPASQLSPERVLENLNTVYNEMNEAVKCGPAKAELLWYMNAQVIDSQTGQLNVSIDPYSVGQVVTFTRRNTDDTEVIPNQTEWQAMRYDPLNTYVGGANSLMQRGDGGLYVQMPEWVNWRVWYLHQPQSMFYGEAEGGTVNTITLPATPTLGRLNGASTNAYAGDLVLVTPSDGIAQVARIISYDSTTRVATCRAMGNTTGNAFTTAPAEGDPMSIVPWFPMAHQEYMCLEAANRFSKRPAYADFPRQIANGSKAWKVYVQRDDMASQRTVKNNGNYPVGTGGVRGIAQSRGGWFPY